MALPYNDPKPRKCLICGEEFLPKTRQGKYCDKIHYQPCPICGKDVEIKSVKQIGKTCGSKECINEKRKRSNIEKFGFPSPLALEEISEKRKKTVRKRYGVDYITQIDEVKKRQVQSRAETRELRKQYKEQLAERYKDL